ncbi:hypothetical protein [Acinetobacter pragensis]|uniref:hypothetical protein n=1 Tax=Acinetobacter pragensis TaxID=1806892 RepID=UPI003341A5D0
MTIQKAQIHQKLHFKNNYLGMGIICAGLLSAPAYAASPAQIKQAAEGGKATLFKYFKRLGQY